MIKDVSGQSEPASKAAIAFAKFGAKTSQLNIEHFSKKSLIFYCNAFHLYEAVYEEAQVYIVGINYLDSESVKNSLQTSAELRKALQPHEIFEATDNTTLNEDPIETYALNRKGFHYSRNENLLHVVYLKENKQALDIPEYLKSVNQSKGDLIRLQMFYNTLLIVQKFHRKKKKIGLLHPFLLFHNQNGLFALDNLQNLVSLFDQFSNYQLLNYFGCFDIDQTQTFDSTFLKTDIVLLSVLLVYLFSCRMLVEEQTVHIYDQILFRISHDFLAQNSKFSKFLEDLKNNSRTIMSKIEKFIKLTLNLSYDEIPEISGYITHFENIFQNEFEKEICCDCKKELGNVFEQKEKDNAQKFKLEVICPWCNEIRCKDCHGKNNESHVCNIPSNDSQIQLDALQNEMEKLRKDRESLPEIGEKKVCDNFKVSMEQIFSQIESEHEYTERKIRSEEEKLNSCIEYVQNLFQTTALEKWKTMKFKNQLLSAALESKKKKMEDEKGKPVDEKAYNSVNVNDLTNEMKNLASQYATYVDKTQEFVSTINMNMQLNNVLDNIKVISMNISSELQEKCVKDFDEKVTTVSNNLLRSLQLFSGLTDDKTSLINEYCLSEDYTNSRYFYQRFILVKEGLLYLFLTPTHEKKPLILKSNDAFSALLEDSRYLHLKTCIVFTGGHTTTIPDNPTDIAFTISYDPKETEQNKSVREANMLPKMKYPREKHMMVSTGHFTFLVVGGMKTSTCEEYNLVTKEWVDMPKLNRPRCNASIYLHNQSYVYTFLGCSEEIYCHDIERLNIAEDCELWEVVNINFISPAVNEMRNNGIKKSENSNEIILVGGITSAKEAVKYNHVFEFSTNSLKITSKPCAAKIYEESMLLEISEGIYYIEKD